MCGPSRESIEYKVPEAGVSSACLHKRKVTREECKEKHNRSQPIRAFLDGDSNSESILYQCRGFGGFLASTGMKYCGTISLAFTEIKSENKMKIKCC